MKLPAHWKKWLLLAVALLVLAAVADYIVVRGTYQDLRQAGKPFGDFTFCHYVERGYQGTDPNPVYTAKVNYSRRRGALRIERTYETGPYAGLSGVKLYDRTGMIGWNIGDSVGSSLACDTSGIDPTGEWRELLPRVRGNGTFLGRQMEDGVAVEVYRLRETTGAGGLPVEITVAFNPQGLPRRIEQDFPVATVATPGVTANRATGYRIVMYPIEYNGDDADTLFMPPEGMLIKVQTGLRDVD